MKNFLLLLVLCASFASTVGAQETLDDVTQGQAASPADRAMLEQSRRDFAAKDYIAAAQDAQQLLIAADSPVETSRAWILLGETFYRRQMVELARTQWNKALALGDPDEQGLDTIAHLGLARGYGAQGQFDKAASEYKIIVAAAENATKGNAADDDTASNVFALELANAHYNTAEFDLARQGFVQIVESSQNDPLFGKEGPFALPIAVRIAESDFNARHFKLALAEYQQILASKNLTPTVEKFVRVQIDFAQQAGRLGLETGRDKAGLRIEFAPDTQFDAKFNSVIQIFMDDIVVDKVVLAEVLLAPDVEP